MAILKKFTFKTTKPTGKFKSFETPYHEIFLNKIQVGIIDHLSFDIRFMVIKKDINEDKNPNCPWKWIQLKRKSNSLQSAKDFILNYNDLIQEKYNLVNS